MSEEHTDNNDHSFQDEIDDMLKDLDSAEDIEKAKKMAERFKRKRSRRGR